MSELYYLYSTKLPLDAICERFLIAPDFAATISNHLCTFSAIPPHPLTWSRVTPDRQYLELLNSSHGDCLGLDLVQDLEALNSNVGKCLIEEFEHKKASASPLRAKITVLPYAGIHWNWINTNLDKVQAVFDNRPFFNLRLGSIKTDGYFLEADSSFVWPPSDLVALYNYSDKEFNIEQGQGLLGGMGYHVGEQGELEHKRRDILSKLYHAHQLKFPPDLPKYQTIGWGLAGSSQRLKKMAESISFFMKSFVARNGSNYKAVAEWTSDLEWMKEEFYKGRFDFEWPREPLRHHFMDAMQEAAPHSDERILSQSEIIERVSSSNSFKKEEMIIHSAEVKIARMAKKERTLR